MRQRTVLDIVIHQGGGFRFGVLCGEYLCKRPERIIVKGLDGADAKIVIPLKKTLYPYGSINHPSISRWIESKGLQRKAGDSLGLVKFHFESRKGADIYEFDSISPLKKKYRHRIVIGEKGFRKGYKSVDELIDIVWK